MSVGESLSAARRAAGMSVADVSERTRIRSTLVTDIERDDFDSCGGAIYARGHIRSIARVVGVDPEPLVAAYDAEHDSAPPPVLTAVAPQSTDAETVARSERHGPHWGAAMAVALVVVCGVAAYGIVAQHHSSHSPGTQAGQHAAVTPSRSPSTAPSTPPTSAAPPVAQVPADEATMLVRATKGESWLSVESASGTQLFQGLLSDGQHKVFSNKHGLTFVIGNAPAVDVVVNGHDIGSPKSTGVVSRGSVSPGSDTAQIS